MKNNFKTLISILLVFAVIGLVSCGTSEKVGDASLADTNSATDLVSEKASETLTVDEFKESTDEYFKNSFVEFRVPQGWFIAKKDDMSVSLFPSSAEDARLTGISIQLIETDGFISAYKYVDMTSSSVPDSKIKTLEPNENGLVFHEVKGIYKSDDLENIIWQMTADTDDNNVIMVAVTADNLEQTEELDILIKSLKVLR